MLAHEFDEWRERYDSMTVEEHAEFYRRLHEDHPDQRHFNAADAIRFFKSIGVGELFVCELGGYDGALAETCLRECGDGIEAWDNFDIDPKDGTCRDSRYCSYRLARQLWDNKPTFPWDVFVASHVIEHLSESDLRSLVKAIATVGWIYFDSPLQDESPTDWSGCTCAHKLTMSWKDVDALMHEHGFERWLDTTSAHCYRKAA